MSITSKAFLKEQQQHVYPVPQMVLQAANNVNTINIRPEYINELSQNLNKHGTSFVDAQIHSNIDSLLQVHRRKMLRRAANRKSAQLSRARKKAHLEELKVENSRLQGLVDVLDSQPELVFCVTALGRITYVSERTINFIKINLSGEESDEDPTHIGQILNAESVKTVLEAILQLRKYSSSQINNDGEANMVFSAKEVYFHDAFGHPLVGYLRCSKVFRRTTLQELQSAEGLDEMCAPVSVSNSGSNNNLGLAVPTMQPVILPPTAPAKKQRGGAKNVSTPSTMTSVSDLFELPHTKGANAEKVKNTMTVEDWNLSKFKLLTDCASSLTGDEVLPSASPSFLAMRPTKFSPPTAFPAEQSLSYNKNGVPELVHDSSNCNNNTGNSIRTVVSFGSHGSRTTTQSVYSETYSEISSHTRNSASNLTLSMLNHSNIHNNNGGGSCSSASSNGSVCSQSQQQQASSSPCTTDMGEDEFVCVIRTSDNCFAPHHMSNCDLLMFSSLLSTASIVAHDLGLSRNGNATSGTLQQLQDNHGQTHRRGSSPNGSSGSNSSKNSSDDVPPNSDSSKETNKNSTSSETGSDDNSDST